MITCATNFKNLEKRLQSLGQIGVRVVNAANREFRQVLPARAEMEMATIALGNPKLEESIPSLLDSFKVRAADANSIEFSLSGIAGVGQMTLDEFKSVLTMDLFEQWVDSYKDLAFYDFKKDGAIDYYGIWTRIQRSIRNNPEHWLGTGLDGQGALNPNGLAAFVQSSKGGSGDFLDKDYLNIGAEELRSLLFAVALDWSEFARRRVGELAGREFFRLMRSSKQ